MITGFRTEPTQDVDAMWEADAAAEWERLNADDPEEEKIKSAGWWLSSAYDSVAEAMTSIGEAVKEADGTVAYDRIVSLLDDLSDLQTELYIMRDNMKEGHC